MGKIFGFNIDQNTALMMFLAGLGIFMYGLFMISMFIADWVEYPSWVDWDFYDIAYLVVYLMAIGFGSYLAIAGVLARKSAKKGK